MNREYMIIPEVRDRLYQLQKEMTSELETINEDIKQAREFGDLSENFSFDNAKSKYNALKKIIDLNEDYLLRVQLVSKEELRETSNTMFKIFDLEVVDWSSSEKETIKKSLMLTPSIDLDLKGIEQVFVSTQLGTNLYEGVRSTWETVGETYIKIVVKRAREYDFSKARI